MDVKHVKGLLGALNTIIDYLIIWLSSIWFLGVGLATTLVLCNLPIKPEYLQIGHLVGIITICELLLLAMGYLVKETLKKVKEGV